MTLKIRFKQLPSKPLPYCTAEVAHVVLAVSELHNRNCNCAGSSGDPLWGTSESAFDGKHGVAGHF
jgi:hypothetical protein